MAHTRQRSAHPASRGGEQWRVNGPGRRTAAVGGQSKGTVAQPTERCCAPPPSTVDSAGWNGR
eukprot:3434841-Pleurochrysis_carterae.AAC.1